MGSIGDAVTFRAEENRAGCPRAFRQTCRPPAGAPCVLPGWEGTSIAIHAITETRLLPAKTQRFIAFLQEQMGRA